MLKTIGWSIVAAAAAWGLTMWWARSAVGAIRRAAEEELQHWQAEAKRARQMVAQLKEERAMWTRARQQGHEDVIAIMPLIAAAQQWLSSGRATEKSESS